MAEVWQAHDEVLRRRVALKLFRPTGDASDSRRVAAEMHTLASLSHPNLVTVHDAGIDGERPYLVMQLVDGPTLAARIAAPGGVPRADAARIGSDLAAGLAHAHQRGTVHRDVKPANVLLSTRDHDDAVTALLADFGIAHSVGQERLTGTGMTIGTTSYLAPEQVTGREVGPPADVYALGLVLLEVLGAAPPWTGTPIEIAMARLTNPPVVPDGLGPLWAPLITAMTAADPAARPGAAQVREAIGGAPLRAPSTAAAPTAVLTGAPATTALLDAAASPPGATALLRAAAPDDERPRRRRPVAWILAGVAAVAVVLAVVLATTASGSGEPRGTSGSPTPAPSTSPVTTAAAVTSAATTAASTPSAASTPTAPGAPGNGPGGAGPPGNGPGGPGGPKDDKTKVKPGK